MIQVVDAMGVEFTDIEVRDVRGIDVIRIDQVKDVTVKNTFCGFSNTSYSVSRLNLTVL